MHQSKFLKTILFTLLLLWSTANAQSPHAGEQAIKAVEEIPEMPLWWQAPESPELGNNHYVGEGVTFLPNFYNGMPAMVLRTADDSIRTWLNRFPGDTQNVFTWKAGYIKQGDFNGDGITDYIDAVGNIYKGVQNGQPPRQNPVKRYGFDGVVYDFKGAIVHDFNNDGFDDVMQASDRLKFGRLTSILYGGSDLNNLSLKALDRWAPIDTNRTLAQVYFTPEGQTRFIVSYSKKNGPFTEQSYEIYRAVWGKGGTVASYEKLTEHKQNSQLSDFREYINEGIYQSKHHNKTFLFLSEMLEGDYYKNNVHIFDITDGTFTETLKFRMDPATNFTMLEGSIDGDEYEDWYISRDKHTVWIFSGGINLDSIPEMIATHVSGGFISIGDVSNDGVNDVAVAEADLYTPSFRIVEGIDLRTDIEVNTEIQTPIFSFSESSPHPVNSSARSSITVNISTPTQYTLSLYTIEGQLIDFVFQGWLEQGDQNISLNFSPYNLSPGSYLLRLSDGVQSIQRTIIITN